MLSTADAYIVERDQRLPGLSVLLDNKEILKYFSQAYPDLGITNVRAQYVRYKPGVSCLVGYKIEAGQKRFSIYARTHSQSHIDKLQTAEQKMDFSSKKRVHVTYEPPLAFFPFPFDHELRALSLLASVPAKERLLKRVLPDSSSVKKLSITTLRYKPERRYVGRLDIDAQPYAVLKLYTQDGFSQARKNAENVHSNSTLRIAEFIGVSRRRKGLAFEWINAPTLMEHLEDKSDPASVGLQLGRAVAELHSQQINAKKRMISPMLAVHAAVTHLQSIHRSLGERAKDLMCALNPTLRDVTGQTCTTHGDLSIDQLLVSGDRIVVLDFDRAAPGVAAQDLGRLQASLIEAALNEAISFDTAMLLFDGVLLGYEEYLPHAFDRRDLPAFVAASLLQVSVEPFRCRRPDWPTATLKILDTAAELLNNERLTS